MDGRYTNRSAFKSSRCVNCAKPMQLLRKTSRFGGLPDLYSFYDAKLKGAGARYYDRTNTGLRLGPDQILARLVASFATQEDEIERFAHPCKG